MATNEKSTMLTPEEVVAQLRALREQIPDYTQLPVPDARSIRRAAAVDAAFRQASINTIGASSAIQNALACTPEELRQDSDLEARWSAAEDELLAMYKGVRAANLVRRHRLGLKALQAYNISQQLVRHKDHAELLPHVANMKGLKKFVRRRPKAIEPPPVVPQQ